MLVFRLNSSSGVPPHLQLAQQLRQALLAGVLALRGAVIDVHAADAAGVLYRVTRALAELDLDIRSAKIQTIGHETSTPSTSSTAPVVRSTTRRPGRRSPPRSATP